jgi:hypothetical protein
MKKRNQFDSLSPVDYRYWDEEAAKYLSEVVSTAKRLTRTRK